MDAMKGGTMKRISIILGFALLVLIGCSSSIDEAMKLYMKENIDRIEILFYTVEGTKGMQPILAQTFMDRENLDRVLSFITKKPAEFYKCGYTGEMIFIQDAQSVLKERMKFSIEPGCEHIVYMFDRNLYSRKISKKGLLFLKELYDKVIKK